MKREGPAPPLVAPARCVPVQVNGRCAARDEDFAVDAHTNTMRDANLSIVEQASARDKVTLSTGSTPVSSEISEQIFCLSI